MVNDNLMTLVQDILANKELGIIDLRNYYIPIMSKYVNDGFPKIAESIEKELVGGNCNWCRKPYSPRKIELFKTSYTLYGPSCNCAPICPSCGRSMHRELDRDEDFCTNCGAIRCHKLTEQTVFTDRGKRTELARCQGRMMITLRGYRCSDCDNTVMPLSRVDFQHPLVMKYEKRNKV